MNQTGEPLPTPTPAAERYVAVIFTSQRTESHSDEYLSLAQRMEELASKQPGFLGIESSRGQDGVGITVSYWTDRSAAGAWKQVAEHQAAQRLGRERFYQWYRLRVCDVIEERAFNAPADVRPLPASS